MVFSVVLVLREGVWEKVIMMCLFLARQEVLHNAIKKLSKAHQNIFFAGFHKFVDKHFELLMTFKHLVALHCALKGTVKQNTSIGWSTSPITLLTAAS